MAAGALFCTIGLSGIQAQGFTYSTSVFYESYGLGANAGFNQPGIAVDSAGNVYLTLANAIEKISATSGVLTVFAGNENASGSADGAAASALFRTPMGLAVDAAGNLYVADAGNNAIRKVTPAGQVSTLAGLTKGSQDGTGIAVQFNNPTSVAVDAAGNVYVVDTGNNALRKVAPNGATTTLLLGSTLTFANALAVAPSFPPSYGIAGVAVGANGVPYVGIGLTVPFGHADFPSNYVAVLQVDGASQSSTVMAPIEITPVNQPVRVPLNTEADGALAADSAGNIYVLVGATIYQVGTGANTNAFPTNAVGAPSALAFDAAGRLYLPDPAGYEIFLATPGYLPVITGQPNGASLPFGGSVPLAVTATAQTASTYQWQLNGQNLSGATTPTFSATLPGSYTVVISNGGFAVTSQPASVVAAARVSNLSTRAFVGTGANVLLAGFVVAGSPGTTEPVLIRAVGPGLAPYGITGSLAQPVLTVFDPSGNIVGANTGWSSSANSSQIAAAANTVGAFALGLDSADSAVLLHLAPGAYSAMVTGANNTSGIALAEVYEMTAGYPQLVNVSSRALVSPGANAAIAGFVVTGAPGATVLVRGVGPSLTNFGVAGTLAAPTLAVVNAAGVTVGTNAGWQSNANASLLVTVEAAVGAFPLLPNDSALLLTLPAGNYSAVVSGTGPAAGVVLVEVYQAPAAGN